MNPRDIIKQNLALKRIFYCSTVKISRKNLHALLKYQQKSHSKGGGNFLCSSYISEMLYAIFLIVFGLAVSLRTAWKALALKF